MPTSPASAFATRPSTEPTVVALGSHLPDDLVAAWRALAFRLDGTSYFQTPDWVLGWWDTVGGRPPTTIATWTGAAGELRALVAQSRVRHRFHARVPLSVPVVVNAGSGAGDADHCGPLVDATARDDVRRWFAARPRRTRRFDHVDDATSAVLPPDTRRLERTTCPQLHIDDPSGPFARSANFRRQLGRFERRLDRDGVSFEWLGPGQVDDGLVADLFRLHRRRRDALDATTSLDTRHERLLRACCATATDTHGPAAVVARAAGQVVAMLFGFVWKDTFSAYQSGWDPAHATNSIGSVLVHQAIRCAAENDVRTFDFLRGTEPYKYRFGAVDTFDASFLVIGDAAGRALLLERALRRGVRRVIPARETPRTDHRDDQPR